jgi:putative endonuclease
MNNKPLGNLGEEMAREFLESKGYEIVKRNYKTKWGEIDLICKDENKIVFVEVKTRIGERLGMPEDAINKGKMQRLIKNAESYMFFNHLKNSYRIDAICIVLDRNNEKERIDHYENITS